MDPKTKLTTFTDARIGEMTGELAEGYATAQGFGAADVLAEARRRLCGEPVRLRYAIVAPTRSCEGEDLERAVAAYLPPNYRAFVDREGVVVLVGEDNAGWSLDEYVIPRLASGLYAAREVTREEAWPS